MPNGVGNPGELRRHAGRLAHDDEATLLPALAIEAQFLRRLPHRIEERVDTGKGVRCMADKAVVANMVHRDAPGPAGAVQELAEALVAALGLLVSEPGDEPVKDLARGER